MTPSPDAPWHRLAPLPRSLWLPALVASVGAAERRLADVQRWRDALAQGQLPDASADFGDAAASAPLRAACMDLGLAALCRGAPAMAEQLLRTLLWHLDRIVDHQPRLVRELAIAQVADDFRAAWTLEKGDWDQLLALLQGLGDLANLRWDELKGHLTSREWREAQRISERLAQLPELAALIRRLGRSHHAPERSRPAPLPQGAAVKRLLGLRPVEIRLPDAPGEVKGIRHTDRLERMLGSEAAMIRHPVLHKLWRARRAEGRLLGYDSEAVLIDLRPDPNATPRPLAAPPAAGTLNRGPIVLCLDTSGSMRGAPENIAKAVALEAFRTAHREGRGCKLIAFGGPDEMLESDLDLHPQGLAALLALMGQAFDGGTDVQGPIERALAAVHEARWRSADLLVVSDGEFGCTPATLARLDAAREELGLRVQGVLVGDRETLGLMELCDDIFWVRDWRRHGDDSGSAQRQGYSPVHSKSLTALYFPNALSGRAARHKPGGV
ncbi:hypothetical protein BurJ1DRAFT_4516 [Burkholderiales bacterium JOSHI_001]|nr:hypothetical protein BurJ1DRAFT_4516 [Burkholderiales bacterium JOSHI_001]